MSISSQLSLANRVALVTGSTRGIGNEIARHLAECGATLVITGTKPDICEQVAAEIREIYSVNSVGISANLTDPTSVTQLIESATAAVGPIHILVNNAGITRDQLLIRMSDSDWSDVITTNLNAAFWTSRAVIRPMMKEKWGRIINISSVIGLLGNAGQINYSAAKGGLIAMTKSIAREYGSKGITCNAVAPGFIETDMIAGFTKESLAPIMGQIPIKRLGTPADVAGIVAVLASDLASYMTGQVISVDGGMHM